MFRSYCTTSTLHYGVEYNGVKMCLREQSAPSGVKLELQRKLHSSYQERQETLLEFSGRLWMLVDKAYHSGLQKDNWKWYISNTA